MGEGIKKHIDELAKVDLKESDADALLELSQKASDLDVEQETLKARQKEKTAELDKVVETLKKNTAETKKRVKLVIPQSLWKEFGIEDKK